MDQMKKLRTVIAGLGRIGWQYHIPEITKHQGFELVAAADPSAERLEEAKREHSINTYSDYEEMLEKEKPDLVVIASPTLFHASQTIRAFEQGADVFLEKPMARSLAEADEMIEAMERFNRKLLVYQPHRITAEYQAVKSIIQSGKLGDIYMIKIAWSQYVRRNDWQAFKKYGGGMLNNYGAHCIDQLLSIADSKAKSISCRLRRIACMGDAEDVVKLLMETENGIILDLDINMASAVNLPEWVIMGHRGSAVFETSGDKRAFRLRYFLPEAVKELPVHEELAAPGREYNNFDVISWNEENMELSGFSQTCFYDKCYEYYALGLPPFVSVHETREVIRVIEECRRQNVSTDDNIAG